MSSVTFVRWQIDFKPNPENPELCESLIVRNLQNENELEEVRGLLKKRLPELVAINNYDTMAFQFKKMLNLSWLRQLIHLMSIEPSLEM